MSEGGEGARYLVIAIDGPAASGKSTTARWVAEELGFRHVDSGSLYRAATAAALRSGVSPREWTQEFVLGRASAVSLALGTTAFVPLIDGADATEEIREPDVTSNVSAVAGMPAVRLWVNAEVRFAARGSDVVADGRDMGTAVFPDADLKVFLVADPWERARRRLIQRLSRHPAADEIAEETERLVRRDAADATQTVQARDAILIDTSVLTQVEQVERIVALARAARSRRPLTPHDGVALPGDGAA